MSIESFNQFQKVVMQDSVLQEQLKAVAATSPEKLGEVAVRLGAERGYSFTLGDMQAAAEASSSSPGAEAALKDEELEMVSGGVTPVGFLVGTVTKVAEQGVRDAIDGEEPLSPEEQPEWRTMRG